MIFVVIREKLNLMNKIIVLITPSILFGLLLASISMGMLPRPLVLIISFILLLNLFRTIIQEAE